MEGLSSLGKLCLWSTDGNFSDGDPAKQRGTTPVWKIKENSHLLTEKDSPSRFRGTLSMQVSGEGELFQSLDNGDTWNDITENLAFPFEYFKDIVFAGSTVYISTDMGVMRSLNSEVWQTLTDSDGDPLLMDWIAAGGRNPLRRA